MTQAALRLADRLLPFGLLGGALGGLWTGRELLGGPFAAAALEPVRAGALLGVVFAAAFGVLLAVARRALPGANVGGAGRALASLVAVVPLVLVGGYLLDRALGIRPSQLTTPWALTRNGAFVVGCVTAAWILGRILARPAPFRTGFGAVIAALGLVGLQLLSAQAFRPGADKATKPDVLVILIDALRADHLSAAGYERPTTPRIDELAADGILFRQAISSSTFTKTSIASLFTGRHPSGHGVYWGSLRGAEGPGTVSSDVLAEDQRTLAEAFRSAGYLTAAWIQNSHLRSFLGFGQGFVAFHEQQGEAPRIDRGFLEFLDGPGRRWPWFVYLHYIDLHDPYQPHPPWLGRFGGSTDVYEGVDLDEWGAHLRGVREGKIEVSEADLETLRALYDEQLAFVDARVGEVLDRLRRTGRYDDTLVVLTADHGDAFLEHGALAHSTTPYEELVRVPLVIKLPGEAHAGTTVADPVRLIDLYPTLLDLLGRQIPRGVDGCSLRPLLDGSGELPPACRTATIEIAEDPDRGPTVAVRTERWKYIHRDGGPDELYDLEADPRERRNLLEEPEPPAVAEDLRRQALAVVASRPEAAGRVQLDAATIEELKALGYL